MKESCTLLLDLTEKKRCVFWGWGPSRHPTGPLEQFSGIFTVVICGFRGVFGCATTQKIILPTSNRCFSYRNRPVFFFRPRIGFSKRPDVRRIERLWSCLQIALCCAVQVCLLMESCCLAEGLSPQVDLCRIFDKCNIWIFKHVMF